MKIFFLFGAFVFYLLGDLFSHLPFSISATLYQLFMNLSYDLDEKIGFKVWNSPLNKDINKG